MNKSRYTAFGYVRQGRLDTTTSTWAASNEQDDRLEAVCDSVKGQAIRVYTIGFQISSSNILDLLEECATDPAMFHNSPTSASLQTAFSTIATELANLRLSK